MDQSYNDLLAQVQGHASMDACSRSSIRSARCRAASRCLFLREGLVIPPAVEPRFRSVIAAANRRNVASTRSMLPGCVHSQQDRRQPARRLTKAARSAPNATPTPVHRGPRAERGDAAVEPEAGLTILSRRRAGC
jgi:hypothetical protein